MNRQLLIECAQYINKGKIDSKIVRRDRARYFYGRLGSEKGSPAGVFIKLGLLDNSTEARQYRRTESFVALVQQWQKILFPEACCKTCGSFLLKGMYLLTWVKRNYCAGSCAASAKETKERRKATCLLRYGTEVPTQNAEVQAKIVATSLRKWGTPRPSQSTKVKNKVARTNMERLGVPYPMQSKAVVAKAEATHLRKRGVKHALQDENIKQQRIQTYLDRYGVENAGMLKSTHRKMEKTNMKNHGVPHASQSEEVQARRREKSLRKYGVDHHSKIPEVHARQTSYKRKMFVTKEGVELSLMGYEPQAAKWMEQHQFRISQPGESIQYGNNQRYHPDLVATRKGKRYLIEVKSSYTITVQPDTLREKVKAALAWCKQEGLEGFVLIVMDTKGRPEAVGKGKKAYSVIRNYAAR